MDLSQKMSLFIEIELTWNFETNGKFQWPRKWIELFEFGTWSPCSEAIWVWHSLMACTVRCACICFYAQVHAFQVSLICAQLFSLSFVLSAAHFMFLNNSTPICVSSYSHSHGCACKRACVCLYVQMFAHESHCASVLYRTLAHGISQPVVNMNLIRLFLHSILCVLSVFFVWFQWVATLCVYSVRWWQKHLAPWFIHMRIEFILLLYNEKNLQAKIYHRHKHKHDRYAHAFVWSSRSDFVYPYLAVCVCWAHTENNRIKFAEKTDSIEADKNNQKTDTKLRKNTPKGRLCLCFKKSTHVSGPSILFHILF